MRKQIFALFFLFGVFGYAGLNAWYGGDVWVETVRESLAEGISLQTVPDTVAKTVSALDESIIGSMYGRMEFIETYSYIQVLLDKREFNNFTYIKDEDGYLHYASFLGRIRMTRRNMPEGCAVCRTMWRRTGRRFCFLSRRENMCVVRQISARECLSMTRTRLWTRRYFI